MMYLNVGDVDSPPPQEKNRNMQKWGNFEREGGRQDVFKTL